MHRLVYELSLGRHHFEWDFDGCRCCGMLATSKGLKGWARCPANPVIANRPAGATDERFASDPAVLRLNREWIVYYFGSMPGYARELLALGDDQSTFMRLQSRSSISAQRLNRRSIRTQTDAHRLAWRPMSFLHRCIRQGGGDKLRCSRHFGCAVSTLVNLPRCIRLSEQTGGGRGEGKREHRLTKDEVLTQ